MRIDVITPVGPGHDAVVGRAAGSVRMAQDNAAAAGLHPKIRHVIIDDKMGSLGRSKARNDAVRDSAADWIFFLDADDMMHPDCLINAEPYLQGEHQAVWGLCHKMEGEYILPRLELPRIVDYKTLLRHHPMATVKMGHFVERVIAQLNPFNEGMDCGEDWDYYLRVWKSHACIKVPLPLYIKVSGQHSTGPRSATGKQWTETVTRLIAAAR